MECEHKHKRVLTNVMPLEMVRRVRNSDLLGGATQLENIAGFTPDISRTKKTNCLVLADGGNNTIAIKPKHRRLIEVTEVSDFQPIQYGNERPWEAIHNGILKQDMAGQRIKMQNGY